MNKLFNSKNGERIISFFISLFVLIFTIIGYSTDLIGKYIGNSIFTSTTIGKGGFILNYFCIAFIALFVVSLLSMVAGNLLLFFKRKKLLLAIVSVLDIALYIFIITIHLLYKMLDTQAIVFFVFSLLLSVLYLAYLIYNHIASEEYIEENTSVTENDTLYRRIILILAIAAAAMVASVIFLPFYSIGLDGVNTSYFLIRTLGSGSCPEFIYIFFVVFVVAAIANILYLVSCITAYLVSRSEFLPKAKISIFMGIIITLVYFLASYFVCFYFRTKEATAKTIAYIPLLIVLVIYILFSVLLGKLNINVEISSSEKKEVKKLEPLLFVVILTIITFLTLVFNVLKIELSTTSFEESISLTGYKLLDTYPTLAGGYQALAFVVFIVLLSSLMLLVASIVAYFAKASDYYKIIKVSSLANVIFMFMLGSFSIYFKIAQRINEENLLSLLKQYGFNVEAGYTYKYNVSGDTIYLFIVGAIVYFIMLARGHFNYKIATEASQCISTNSIASESSTIGNKIDLDACPAFSELDSKIELYRSDLEARRKQLFENLTLPNLVRFVVDYARECRLHLSYTVEDIATFVAGLGASRLAILQGMSGTGKTSLPKIFAEAILGNCEVVEVESSWRDKNELLGYYNEFSKCFTPKKFTQCLYKARLNPEIITFIVLDEMNLSRIEYYFSDFLSLMEHEEHLRSIKLLNVKLFRTVDGNINEYYGLTEGHTIAIPTNVWFIGTANRDESTFEISDKVYDRAQTMNFNKRAPKIHSFTEPIDQRYVCYDMLSKLFTDAKNTFSFEVEDNEIIIQAEKLLQPYNISFGNRILRQMEDFVKIYCSCFGDERAVLNEAVEKILLSKVVSKLETKIVENKEELASSFDKLGLTACSAFIRKLNED